MTPSSSFRADLERHIAEVPEARTLRRFAAYAESLQVGFGGSLVFSRGYVTSKGPVMLSVVRGRVCLLDVDTDAILAWDPTGVVLHAKWKERQVEVSLLLSELGIA